MKLKIISPETISVVGIDGAPVMVIKISEGLLQPIKLVPTWKGIKGDKGDNGTGDMEKIIYDTNNDGVVDNAEKLSGYTLNNLPLNGGYF